MLRQLAAALILFAWSVSAHANLVLPAEMGTGIPRDIMSELRWGWDLTYRIGSKWGKDKVTVGQLEKESKGFRRMAMATGQIRGGTVFYLGKFNDRHVAATNHHVLSTAGRCRDEKLGRVRFPWLDLNLRCEQILGTWKPVDLTLFALNVEDTDSERLLHDVRGNFAFDADIYPGQALITIGFGKADNPLAEMVANQDEDCKVFSERNDFKLLDDLDKVNPGDYKAWSFANGCDVSHGDSGSAMVDRKTGDIVGIIWTGAIPKNKKVQDSKFLDGLLVKPNDVIWKELSYAVPSSKIKEHLKDYLKGTELSKDVSTTLEMVIND